jgi:MurNAc alpha-1-phosphate uridylyltransferase
MKAMILAAGRGLRMAPLTDNRPKPLLEAGGQPLITWHLEKLAAAHIREVVVNVAHLGSMIEESLGDGNRFGVSIQYSRETEALETAGGIAWALSKLGDEPFLVINADVYSDLDYTKLRNQDMASAVQAHLVLVPNPSHHPSGDFRLSDGLVTNGENELWTYSGLGIYRPELFGTIVPGAKCPLAPLLRQAADDGRVSGQLHSGFWMDVGNPQRLQELDRHIRPRAL